MQRRENDQETSFEVEKEDIGEKCRKHEKVDAKLDEVFFFKKKRKE